MADHDLRCPAPQYWHSPGTAMAACQCDLIAKVRADESNKHLAERLNLCAKVEALGHTNVCSIQLRSPKYRQCTCFQKPVLALIDGLVDD